MPKSSKSHIKKQEPVETNTGNQAPDEKITIAKPTKFNLDKFKSKSSPAASVGALPDALPHHKIADAKDYVRLHPDEANYWSAELCFISVPVKGGRKQETLHLIDEELAKRHRLLDKVQRFRLALATKPHDVFFLCHIPTQNTDNLWNVSALQACERAKTLWVEVMSLKSEGKEGYRINPAEDQDFAPQPKWPAQSLSELIAATFEGRMIENDNDPALLRLRGKRQVIS